MKDIFLVDVDDTILDFHGASADALRFACAKNGIEWDDFLEKEYRVFNTSLWERLECKELTRERLMKERFMWFFQEMGRKDVDGYAINDAYIQYISKNPKYIEGAEEFLFQLAQMGKIYLVTNGTEEIQQSRFTIAKLWEKAEKVFISQQVGFDKPAKEYTDYVTAHIEGFSIERAVWIGDSLSADIKAANDANVSSIWFNPRKKALSNHANPDYIVENFDQILKILQKNNKNL